MRSVRIVTVVFCQLCLASHLPAAEDAVPPQIFTLQKQAAKFLDAKDVPSAVAEYEKIARDFAGSDHAIDAQGKVVGLFIQMGQRAKADAAVEKLMANPSEVSAFRKAVHAAGQAYRWKAKDPAKGRAIYSQWLDKYSADPEAYKIQHAVVKTYLEEKDIAGAALSLERFKQLCLGRADVYHEMADLTSLYLKLDQPETALELNQWFISEFPQHEKVCKSLASQININLDGNDRDKADAAVERLMANPTATLAFRQAVHSAGQAYRWKANDPVKGRAIYNLWMEKYSADPEAYKIQHAVVKTYLEEKDIAGANSALKRFKQLCASRADVHHEMADLVSSYQKLRHPEMALELNQWFVSAFPQHEKACQSYAWQITAYLNGDHRSEADAAVAKLMANPSETPAFRKAVHATGQAYRWKANDPAKGREIYNQWLDRYSADPEAYEIQGAVVKTYLEEKDIAGANTALERFKQLCAGRADVHHEVADLARFYQKLEHPEISLDLHQWFTSEFPQHEKACQSYASQVNLHLGGKDRIKADAAVEKLMANPSGSSAYRQAVLSAGRTYRWKANDPAKGREIYNQWLEKYGAAPKAYEVQCAVVKTWLEERNLEGAKIALERFKQLYANHPEAYRDMVHLVSEMARAGDVTTAMNVVEEVFAPNLEGKDRQLFGLIARARMYVYQGKDAEMATAVKKALSLFADNSGILFKELLGIGEEYYSVGIKTGERRYHEEAVGVLKSTSAKAKDDVKLSAEIDYVLGLSYLQLEDYVNAIDAFKSAYLKNPDFMYADYCLFSVGNLTEKIMDQYPESVDETRELVCAIYSEFLHVYPDSKGADYVRKWLDNNCR